MILNANSIKHLDSDQLATLRRLVDAEQRRRSASKPAGSPSTDKEVSEQASALWDEMTGEDKRKEARKKAAVIEREMRGRR